MSAKNTTILLIDDKDSVRRAVARRLNEAGFTTTAAGTGAAAFAATANGAYFDVGIVDIELPDVGGVWLAERLVLLQRVGRVVFFTATVHELSLRLARAHGCVISKSEGADGIIAAIRNEAPQTKKR